MRYPDENEPTCERQNDSRPQLNRFEGTPIPSTSIQLQPSCIPSLNKVLGASQPSLSHLVPILFDLGIRTEEDLKAVGKMTAGTRDSVLKEPALERGVTLFEWAMLLDKMKSM